MPYFVNPIDKDQCVFLSCEGEVPTLELSAARQEANGVLDQRHWNRMVVDVTRLRSVPTARDLFQLAQGFSRDISRWVRVGLVVCPEQARHARLIEKVARQGRVFLTYFLDPERATG